MGGGGVREKKIHGVQFFPGLVETRESSLIFLFIKFIMLSDGDLFLILHSTKIKTNLASLTHFHRTIKDPYKVCSFFSPPLKIRSTYRKFINRHKIIIERDFQARNTFFSKIIFMKRKK